jgi:hypothetical protein
MAVKQEWRREMNAALGRARALAASNPVAAQNEAMRAQQIAQQSGTAQTQAAVARAYNEVRNINTAPGFYGPPPGGGSPEVTPEVTPDDTGGGDTTPADTGPSQEELNARRNAVDMLADRLAQWGISGLSGMLNDLVVEFGPESVSTIMARVRQTDQYKQRFKGLLDLRGRGIMDIPDEGRYLELERGYRQVFREAGLRDYLGTAGSQSEYDAIARIVGDFSLSVNEVRDRVTDAQRVVAETPQEVRDSLQRFYGIDPSLLTQYVLDPDNTTTQIQRRANAAIVGGYATRAGLEFGAGASERIGEYLGRGEDILGTAIEPQLTEISDIEKATKRLADIERKALTDEEVALSTLDLDQGAREKVRGLQSRERARFGGRSAIGSAALKRPRSI